MKQFFVGLERYWLFFSRSVRFWCFVVLMIVVALFCAGIGDHHIRFVSWFMGISAPILPYSVVTALILYKVFVFALFPILFFIATALVFPSDTFMIHSLVMGKAPLTADRLSLFTIFLFCALVGVTVSFVSFQLFLCARFSFIFVDLQLKMFLMLVLYAIPCCGIALLSVTLFQIRTARLVFASVFWILILIFLRFTDTVQGPYFGVAREWNTLQLSGLGLVSELSVSLSIIVYRISFAKGSRLSTE